MTHSTTLNTTPQISESDLYKERIIEAIQELPPREYEKVFYLISRPALIAKIHETTKDLPHDEMGMAVRRMVEADMEAANG